MSVLEYCKLIISIISVSNGLQIAFKLISIFACFCGYICGFLVFWAFRMLEKYRGVDDAK